MNKLGGVDKFPFFFLPFTLVGERGIGDGGVLQCWFEGDGV